MSNSDEPLFDSRTPEAEAPDASEELSERIRRLVRGQPYGVLGTQNQSQPYGALVAFAFTDDLKQAVLATPVATRKFRFLSECPRMSLVVDNRPDHRNDVMSVEAVTITGQATLVERGADWECWSKLLLDRHPTLETFVSAPSCALFRIDVVRFFHVARFQEVGQWIP